MLNLFLLPYPTKKKKKKKNNENKTKTNETQPNGRFEVGKKICLSITGHHPEYWQPAWGSKSRPVATHRHF
jgi:ubiquitin-conjugating enzyme E2 J1